MITDIYLKHIDEPGYEELSFIEKEEFEILLAQIRMTLLTPKGSVLGSIPFGVDEESGLFTFSDSFDIIGLESAIRQQLKTYCTLLKNRDWSISVKLLNDEIDQFRDSIHVLITVDKKVAFVIAYN